VTRRTLGPNFSREGIRTTRRPDTVSLVILTGERVLLRPGTDGDVERLQAIVREPEVAMRWGAFEPGEVREHFTGKDEAFVIEADGEVVGAIQYAEEEDPMYRHAGIDIFLTARRHRQGLGSDAIRTLARHLFVERGHHRLSIDPALDDLAAIAAYEAVGFRRVGVMRRYERGPDGTWHDGLLMDMLEGELT
jgi:aminoglycoside 6'-N-acetyltransferase